MDGVAFYLLAAGTLAAAFGAASGSRLLHSALLLTAAFIGTGCLYILLDADFLGAVQFMVYSGGIAVLIVLGIMLTHRPSEEKKGAGHAHRYSAGFIAGGFVLFLLLSVLQTPLSVTAVSVQDTVAALSELMLGRYILAFEAAAVLLLAATIGTILLARGEEDV